MYFHHALDYKTEKQLQIIDITDKVKHIVHGSTVKNGIVHIQSLRTTAVVLVNERETLLHEDFRKHLHHVASPDDAYRHDDFSVRDREYVRRRMCERPRAVQSPPSSDIGYTQ